MYDHTQVYVRLPLENAGNVRDLGGYPAEGGKVTQFKRFLRSGTLAYLTSEEKQFLLDYGVTTFIDLRTDGEAKHEINPFNDVPDVTYLHLPLFVGDLKSMPYEADNLNAMADMYTYMFNECGDMIVRIMQAIAEARDGIVLYHCSAGKDRTGILSYILLALGGVSQEDILANYQVTETYYLPLFKKYAPDFNEIPIQYLRSETHSLEKTILYVEKEFGNIKNFLLARGVTAAQIERVKARLL